MSGLSFTDRYQREEIKEQTTTIHNAIDSAYQIADRMPHSPESEDVYRLEMIIRAIKKYSYHLEKIKDEIHEHMRDVAFKRLQEASFVLGEDSEV